MGLQEIEMQATTITITYTSRVKVQAGWRAVTVKAEAEQVSPGFAVVRRVVEIDGETPNKGQSRTGASRQAFNGVFWSGLQVGAKKRLSSCTIH